jgi:uncharacterized membrane protein YagU involved in acid resistance
MARTINWKAAVWAGIIAGLVFLVLEMLLVQLVGAGSMWGPPRMMAAIVIGREVLPPPATFDAGVFIIAMIVHFVLSLIYAFIFAWIVGQWQMTMTVAAIGGLLFGLVIYAVNFYGFTAVFPWFAEARNWITILAHAIFGLTLGVVYEPLARKGSSRTVAVSGS